MYNILIKNGTVIDGTGQPMRKADVAIKKNKIVAVEDSIPEKKGREVIDATGHFITPGFIDIQNHSDAYWTIFLSPEMESLVYQGITTMLVGKCGSSLAPLMAPNIIESIHKWADLANMQASWATLDEFFAVVKNQGLGINMATLVGHTTLRYGILGNAIREATVGEIDMLKKQVEIAMKRGAFGYSTGLNFAPVNTDSTKLIIELARIASRDGGIYSTHMRSESRAVLKAVQEAATVAREADIAVQISHLKSKEEKNWHKMDEVLHEIDYANENGVNLTFDIYPYTSTGAALSIYLPDEAFRGGVAMMLKRLRDPYETQNVLIPKMREMKHEYRFMQIAYAKDSPHFAGKYILDIAQELGQSPEETIIDIIVATSNTCLCFNEIVLEDNIIMALQSKYSMIGSGGPGYSVDLAKSQDNLIHPRSFGAFTRILQYYTRDNPILTWESAVHKMTGMPAQKIGFKKRGLLQKGYIADIAVWDPARIEEKATFDDPYQYAEGMEAVLVGGKFVLKDKQATRERPGEIIKY